MLARSAALLTLALAVPTGAAAQGSRDLRVPDIFREAPRPEAPRSEASRSEASRSEASRSEVPRSEVPRSEVPDATPRDLVVPDIFRSDADPPGRGAIPPELRVPEGFAEDDDAAPSRAHAELRVPEIFRGPRSPGASDLRYPAGWPRTPVEPRDAPPRTEVPSELRVPEAFGGGGREGRPPSELRRPVGWSAAPAAEGMHVAREALGDPAPPASRPRDELAAPR